MSSSFLWVPGNGPDPAALARMAAAFPKPKKPMGEAWFMSPEREMYPQLLSELSAVDDTEIERALEEISSGTTCFGRYEEWVEWYHYLLPRLIERRWNTSYYNQAELLFTAFMAQYPDANGNMPYAHFQPDALITLGRYIMSGDCWPRGQLDARKCLSKWTGPTGIAGWFDAGGLLSASLFFCLKYLASEEVEPWFQSVIDTPSRLWRVQVITWLVGAHSILTNEIEQPSQLPEVASPSITWAWSHALKGDYPGADGQTRRPVPFLPAQNREVILGMSQSWDVEEFLSDFMTDPDTPAVAAEIVGVPELFLEFYRSAS